MKRFTLLINLVISLLLIRFDDRLAAVERSYPLDESLCKGDKLEIPEELQNGTATFENLKDWSNSVSLCYNNSKEDKPLQIEQINLDNESEKELLVRLYAAQNSLYFVFKKINANYRYVGTLEYSHIRILRYNISKTYILTSATAGGGELIIDLSILKDNEIQKVASQIKLNSWNENGEEIKENTKLYKKLFQLDISEQELKNLFSLHNLAD